MYVVIKEGGKQYQVCKGDMVDVEKKDIEEGETFNFENVMLYSDEEKKDLRIGQPTLADVTVTAEVKGLVAGDKVEAYKFKRRKGHHKLTGHRQKYTRVVIKDIQAK